MRDPASPGGAAARRAVVGVGRATDHIVTGQRIAVDGTSGMIVTLCLRLG